METKEAPTPQPEQREPQLHDPGLTDLSAQDYKAILTRAGKQALAHRRAQLAEMLQVAGQLHCHVHVVLLGLGPMHR